MSVIPGPNLMAVQTHRVHLLDPLTINQIAAGEVVERPASVVKELVENALDAGADRIEVELISSGKSLIRVSDNGCGMSSQDVIAALQRHATSKIASIEDLAQVGTLGFRGEAVPSIASVSRMTISSSEDDSGRTEIKIEGGEENPPKTVPGPKGTTVSVEDLFFNTPARLKFLKSDSTELGACLEVLNKCAMGYPGVAFSVTHNGQEALRTSGSGQLIEAIADIWGRDYARALAEVDVVSAGIGIKGYVSPPHLTRPTRAYQYLFVNQRPVKSRTLGAALDQAYRDLTPERRFPMIALMLTIDPDRIDVNVSPTKSEVKFQHEGQAFDAIRYSIRQSLTDHGMMPSAEGIAAANEALAMVQQPDLGSMNREIYSSDSARQAFEMSLAAQAPGLAPQPIFSPSTSSERYPFADLIEGLRVLGQAMNTFIVAETKRGIVIIDQHVAHERVLYEYLCGLKGPGAIEKQALLTPEALHLDRRAAVLLRERLEEVVKVGFDIEPFGGESFLVRAVPAAVQRKGAITVLRDLIDELVDAAVARRLTPTREQIWITSSCKMAVKAGDPLSIAEMEKLIVDLSTTENPYLCPHGRPITITLSTDELLRKFKRM